MAEPVKGIAYEFPLGLDSVLEAGFQVNPTLASGDFKISKDFGPFFNLATLPVVSPAGSAQVMVNLSAAEMNADKVFVAAKDVAGNEWEDVQAFIDAPEANSQSAVDILEGDRNESSVNYKIFKKGTTQVLVEKDITGSLLRSDITIATLEP